MRIYWAVDHDIIPLDGANVFQQGGIDSISDRVALAEDPTDFWCLPVDDACQDQVQTAAGGLSGALCLTRRDRPPLWRQPNLGVQIPWPRFSVEVWNDGFLSV